MHTTPRLSYSWLNSATDDELGGSVLSIITAMTDNEFFPTPVPALADVQGLLAGFQSAQAAAANGGKLETAAKNSARTALVDSSRSLGGYIDTAAAGLLENLLSSNYPLQKDRAPVDIQPAPSNLRLKHGKVSGSITVACAPNSRRVIYEWQSAVGQTPVDWKSEPPTNSASCAIDGNAPGSWLNVRVRARVTAGSGDWSGVSQIMVV
jgi:hypothetical protein